jgi:Ca-activated chloride channel homolog
MRFTAPLYLLLFLPSILGLIWSFRHVHGLMKWRKTFSFFLRFCLAGCLIVALAGPEMRRSNEGLCTIFVLDRSDSVNETERKRAEEFVDQAMRALKPEDMAGVIVFGQDAAVDVAPGRFRGLDRILSVVDGSASDIAAAIRLASASFPDGKGRRIVLLTDGNETSGDVAEAANVAAADGIQIDHVALGGHESLREVAVVETQARSEARAGEPFDVRVVVESTHDTVGQLVLDREGTIVKQQQVRINRGRTSLVVGEVLDQPGFHRYRATLMVEEDSDPRNNVGMGFVALRERQRVLVVQQEAGSSPLGRTLQEQGLAVDVYGPSGIPTRPEELQAYDALIFNDVNAVTMTPQQMRMIQAAVRESGMGFAMVGGENSFLSGGYYGTPIADVLPVDLNIRQRKSFPSTSILIVVDASGSMGVIEDGVPKIRLAAKAAEVTVEMMSPIDRVGVAGSADAIRYVAPMQKLSDKPSVIQQIRKLDLGGGGIYCRPSLEFAERELGREPSKVRHLILVADGDDADMQEGCLEIANRMKNNKITTSVMCIGQGKDVEFLKRLAVAGGGRFYMASKVGELAAIFTQDAAVMARSAIEEGAFLPKTMLGEESLRGIQHDSIPPLFAYCLTDSRPLSRVGMRTHKDDPLLATWQYGLGTSLAFTSDAQPRWAARWMSWGDFGKFWAQAVRSIARRAALNDYQVSTRYEGGRGFIELKAVDAYGALINHLGAQVTVSAPDGDAKEVSLRQIAPGTYSGAFDANQIGSYIVTVAEDDPAGGKRVSTSGFSIAYPAEYRAFRANTPLLQRLSNATGGIELAEPAQVARPVVDPGFSLRELWPLFVLIGALLLPVDIAARRVALPVAEILAKGLALLRRRRRTEEPVANPVDRLRTAKQRAQVQPGNGEARQVVHIEREAVQEREDNKAAAGAGSAASKLLESKRKRRDGGE